MIAIENGYQVAVLAPTEILATQHYFYFKQLFSEAGLCDGAADRLVHRRARRRSSRSWWRTGLAQVVIGTHALLEKDVEFEKLGLAIIDEQHRFGVMQRLELVAEGRHIRTCW